MLAEGSEVHCRMLLPTSIALLRIAYKYAKRKPLTNPCQPSHDPPVASLNIQISDPRRIIFHGSLMHEVRHACEDEADGDPKTGADV